MSDFPCKLLGHPRLQEKESLASFLIRLGESNFYQPLSILTELIFDGIDRETPRKDRADLPRQVPVFERIRSLTEIECLCLYEASTHRFAPVLTPPNADVSTMALPGNHVVPLIAEGIAQKQVRSTFTCQYCPACLQQRPYHHLIWHLIATSICIEHKCLLVAQCYNCNGSIRIQDIINAYCYQCSADLRKAPCVSIGDDELGFLSQRVIQGWLLDTPVSLPDRDYLPPHPPNILFRVIEGLRFTAQRLANSGWVHLHTLPDYHNPLATPFRGDSRTLTPYQSFCVYTTAFNGIINWPRGFYEFLDVQHNQYSKIARTGRVQQDFGSTYSHWIQREWQHPAFNFVQDAFNLYIAERYGISLSILRSNRFRSLPGLLHKFSLVSINYAAELVGVTPATIRRLINSGQLEMVNEDSLFVRQKDVLRLQATWEHLVDLEEAIQILGVSKDVILDMVNVHLLFPEQSPQNGFVSWKFSKKELYQILDEIQNHTPVYEKSDIAKLTVVSLAGAARRLAKFGLNAAMIIAQIIDGELQACRQPNKQFSCKDLLFECSKIDVYIRQELDKQGWMSRKEVTKYLKVKDGTLGKWVKAGLLIPITVYTSAQYFNKVEIEKFFAEHITCKEAAELLDIGVLTIQKWVRQGRLEAVSGPGIDLYHEYLFNKENLLQWRNERLTFGETANILRVSTATLHHWINDGKLVPLNDMGGKQRWFAKEAVLTLRQKIMEQKTNSLNKPLLGLKNI